MAQRSWGAPAAPRGSAGKKGCPRARHSTPPQTKHKGLEPAPPPSPGSTAYRSCETPPGVRSSRRGSRGCGQRPWQPGTARGYTRGHGGAEGADMAAKRSLRWEMGLEMSDSLGTVRAGRVRACAWSPHAHRAHTAPRIGAQGSVQVSSRVSGFDACSLRAMKGIVKARMFRASCHSHSAATARASALLGSVRRLRGTRDAGGAVRDCSESTTAPPWRFAGEREWRRGGFRARLRAGVVRMRLSRTTCQPPGSWYRRTGQTDTAEAQHHQAGGKCGGFCDHCGRGLRPCRRPEESERHPWFTHDTWREATRGEAGEKAVGGPAKEARLLRRADADGAVEAGGEAVAASGDGALVGRCGGGVHRQRTRAEPAGNANALSHSSWRLF